MTDRRHLNPRNHAHSGRSSSDRGGGGCGRQGSAGAGDADRRLGDPPALILWRSAIKQSYRRLPTIGRLKAFGTLDTVGLFAAGSRISRGD